MLARIRWPLVGKAPRKRIVVCLFASIYILHTVCHFGFCHLAESWSKILVEWEARMLPDTSRKLRSGYAKLDMDWVLMSSIDPEYHVESAALSNSCLSSVIVNTFHDTCSLFNCWDPRNTWEDRSRGWQGKSRSSCVHLTLGGVLHIIEIVKTKLHVIIDDEVHQK